MGTEWSFVEHPVLVSCKRELADIFAVCLEKPGETHFVEILLFLGVEVPKDLKTIIKERLKC